MKSRENSYINNNFNDFIPEFHNLHPTDNDYELALRDSLRGKYVIVLVGHSGSGYRGNKCILCDHMHNKIRKIMESHQPETLNPEEVIVIAGGTPEGIGAVYGVASDMNLHSLGIVAIRGKEGCTPQCQKIITVRNEDPDDWTTRMPESGEEMVVAALCVAKDTGKGGELLVYNGGKQAYIEALAAANAGHSVTLIRDFKSVDTHRDQPFNVEYNLRILQKSGVIFNDS